MRRVTTLLATLAVVMLAAGVNAQGKPDFAGKWTREAPAGGAPTGGGGGGGGRGGGGGQGFGGGGGFNCGMTCTIAVSGNTLTVTRPGQQGGADIVTKFEMAGEATNAGGRDGSQQIKTTGKLEGGKLVLSTPRTGQDGTTTTSTQTLSIEGGKLTVVTNSGREGATPQTATYTKG